MVSYLNQIRMVHHYNLHGEATGQANVQTVILTYPYRSLEPHSENTVIILLLLLHHKV